MNPHLGKILVFWLQTVTAIGLCLWVGFEYSLPLISSAAITVCILSAPSAGSVFSKSKWRFMGTLAGGTVIAFLALWFAQAPWLFLLGLAVWTGICSYISAHFRYFQAYAAALSGYTATIILVEIHDHFSLVAFSTVQRVAEICLGVACVALVFGLTHIRKGIRRLEPEMHLLGKRTLDITRSILDTPSRRHVVEQLREWARQTENLQHNLLLVGEEEGILARQSKSIRTALSDLYGPLTYFCDALLALGQAKNTAEVIAAKACVIDCLTQLTQAHNDAQAVRLIMDEQLPVLSKALNCAAASIDDSLRQSRILAIRPAMTTLLQSLLDYRKVRHDPLASPVRATGKQLIERKIAIFQAIGVAIGYLAFCWFWIESGWESGDVGLLMFVAISMIQMASDKPVLNLLDMLYGLCFAVLVALPLKFIVLPMGSGFGWLMLCTAIGMLPGCAFKTLPAKASVGSGYLMFFALLMGFDDLSSYDMQETMNQIVAMCISIFAAIVLMAAVHPWRAQSRLRMMLKEARHDFNQTVSSLHRGDTLAMAQWEDRQFLRLLQLDHVTLLPTPALADRAADNLLRQCSILRNRYPHSTSSIGT